MRGMARLRIGKTTAEKNPLAPSPSKGVSRSVKRTRTISALTELGKRCAIGLTVTVAAIPSAIAAPPTDLDARVEAAMDAFDQPGLALAIVEPDDTTVRGYGVTQAGGDTPVTEQTIFNIASVTKAFTAAALAILVDEGMVEWEAPVRRYLPEFAMSDPYLTEHMTVRDLLVHRSGLGLGAGDLMIWPGTDFTAPRSSIESAICRSKAVSAPATPMTICSTSSPGN